MTAVGMRRAPSAAVGARRTRGAGLFAPQAETALHPVLRELAGRLPGAARGCWLFEEFDGPWGVPDLVALVASSEAVAARQATGVGPLRSELDCRLVVAASRWLDAGALERMSGTEPVTTRRRAADLVRRGALIRDARGRVRSAPGIAPMGRVWALEAKVDAWRAGLGQTQRYRLWADGAVLVLGRSTADRAEIAHRAEQLRVGVFSDGRWVRHARLALPGPARRLWASEHVAAALQPCVGRSEATASRDDSRGTSTW